MDVIGEVDWDHKELSFAKMKPLFRENFKRGNQLMYSSLSILIFLFLSLYTASQMTGMLFLMIDFLLVVLLIMISVASLMGFVVSSRYEISLNNLIKLSLILLFKEIKASLAIVVLLVVLIVMTIKLPAITFFVGSGIMAYFLNNLGEKIEKSLVLE